MNTHLSKHLFYYLLCFSVVTYADFEEGGAAYLRGDYKTAAAEFIPLAERGDHRAMYALGAMYSEGQGVEKDLKKAFALFTEAAKNGRADAMFKLGLMYEEGIGIKPNLKKALRFYQKSAKQGYPLGQYRFGLMYANGSGVKRNPVAAYAWLVVAGHYFIYEVAQPNLDESSNMPENKRQLFLFQQQEKDRILDEIISKLQVLKEDMNADDIEKTRQRVIKYSQYRKRYHKLSVRDGRIGSDIENLFLPETLH